MRIGRKILRRRSKRRVRAKDFGDKADVRHSYGEHERFSRNEPWEVAYRKRKRSEK